MPVVECADCGDVQTFTPQFYHDGMPACVWCMHAKGQITDEQLEALCSESQSS